MRHCAGFGPTECKNVPVNGKSLCNTCSSRKKRQKQRETVSTLQTQYQSLQDKYDALFNEHNSITVRYQQQFDALLSEYNRLLREHITLKETLPFTEDSTQSIPQTKTITTSFKPSRNSNKEQNSNDAEDDPSVTACRLLLLSQQATNFCNSNASLETSCSSSSLSLPFEQPAYFLNASHAVLPSPSVSTSVNCCHQPNHFSQSSISASSSSSDLSSVSQL